MEYIFKFTTVLLAMALVDVCWAYYFIKVSERKSLASGGWAVLLFITGAFVTSNYVEDKTFIVAAALGSFIGTYFTVEYKRRVEDKEPKEDKKPNS